MAIAVASLFMGTSWAGIGGRGRGWLLAFTISLDNLVTASFVSGPGASTSPMVTYSKVRLGVSPDINALATIMVALRVLIAGLVTLCRDHTRQRDMLMALSSDFSTE